MRLSKKPDIEMQKNLNTAWNLLPYNHIKNMLNYQWSNASSQNNSKSKVFLKQEKAICSCIKNWNISLSRQLFTKDGIRVHFKLSS